MENAGNLLAMICKIHFVVSRDVHVITISSVGIGAKNGQNSNQKD